MAGRTRERCRPRFDGYFENTTGIISLNNEGFSHVISTRLESPAK